MTNQTQLIAGGSKMEVVEVMAKGSKQAKVIRELQEAFGNVETFTVVNAPKWTSVYMTYVRRDCKDRLCNVFRVGLRGGLTVVQQEFTPND